MVDRIRRSELMAEKGDTRLFELFTCEREDEEGKIKPFYEHDAFILRDSRTKILEDYELSKLNKEEEQQKSSHVTLW